MQPLINKLIGENKRNKKELSKKVKKMLMTFALDAYKLDKNQSVKQYYGMYVNYLRKKWNEMDENERQIFFDKKIIEI